ncbi:peptidoglycan DD-metalloendopeptidase family protein [Luteococcus sp. H138]|uniref:peptidoglycan DD-metalloendopeptidase family protein n=1 Tax=unclassified Luteococcus TaxID=2639923 RepID=UPI00313ABA35
MEASASWARAGRFAVVGVTALSMGLSLAPVASADELTDERDRINARRAASQNQLSEFSAELNQAAETLATSQAKLTKAREALAAATAARKAAQAEDAKQAKALRQARTKLAQAQRDVAENERRVQTEARLVGATVRETHQQNTELLGIAAFVTDIETGDVNSKMQWSSTIFNATQAQMDRLQVLQVKLEAARKAQTEAEKEVSAARERAAEKLTASRAAASQADRAAASVHELVAVNRRAKAAAADKVAAEKERQKVLAAESGAVQQRIQRRIAAQKAAEAKAAAEQAKQRQQAADKKAAAEKAAARRAAGKKSSSEQKPSATASKAASAPAATSAPVATTPAVSGNGGFSSPVGGPVTSPFGQRLHPVLHIWKLHDGMDFGAACGAPMMAPADGVVTEQYFNAGYGNRLILDHGNVGGHYVTTAYNHATNYVVGVGQRVRKGQVIGYVGTTGYSTGCHLHLMVWRDGALVNPSTYF